MTNDHKERKDKGGNNSGNASGNKNETHKTLVGSVNVYNRSTNVD